MYIIIKGKTKFGRSRSEQEENLRKEWGPTMNEEQLDKLKHLEKKCEEKTGTKDTFIAAGTIDQVK